jgi:hypothetical protein
LGSQDAVLCGQATLAEIAQRLGRKALEELAAVAKPDTLLAWYRKLIADKFDGSRFRQRVGRPRIDEEAERLVLQMAKENPNWGYATFSVGMASLLLPGEDRPSPFPGKTLSVHTWKFWWGRG